MAACVLCLRAMSALKHKLSESLAGGDDYDKIKNGSGSQIKQHYFAALEI